MNPARLAELRHQRALVCEQLAWLDREIAKEGAVAAPPVAVPSGPLAGPVALAEIEAYTPDPISAVAETRRGCFIAVAVVFLLMIAALSAIYVWRYSDRPLIFVSGENRTTSDPVSPSAPKK